MSPARISKAPHQLLTHQLGGVFAFPPVLDAVLALSQYNSGAGWQTFHPQQLCCSKTFERSSGLRLVECKKIEWQSGSVCFSTD